METKFQTNNVVRSLLPIHENNFQFWRVETVEVGERTGKTRYFCKSLAAGLKSTYGVDSIKRDFNENEIELS